MQKSTRVCVLLAAFSTTPVPSQCFDAFDIENVGPNVGWAPRDFVPLGSSVACLATSPGFTHLAFSDGVRFWTVRLPTSVQHTARLSSHRLGNRDVLWFYAGPNPYQLEPWISDGTQAGTRPMTGPRPSSLYPYRQLALATTFTNNPG